MLLGNINVVKIVFKPILFPYFHFIKLNKMKNKALLVGINKYPNPSNELRGCINDINDMQHYISETNKVYKAENIMVLKDHMATKKNIQDHLNWLLEDIEAGDQILFHYSGHGAQLPTQNHKEELDGKDEIICPYDFDWSPSTTFRDKEFALLFNAIPKDVHFVWISDSCHAEDLSRDPIVQSDTKFRNFAGKPLEANTNFIHEPSILLSPLNLNGVLLSACASNQLSADAYIENRFNGAFTHYLIKQLNTQPKHTPLSVIIKNVNKELSKNGYDQTPQTEGLLSSASFFL